MVLRQTLAYISRPEGSGYGTPTPSLPGISAITKGFRVGELVVFTGPTGMYGQYE